MAGIDGLRGFRVLRAADRSAITAATREVRAHKGTMLFRQGQSADSVWAVKEGLIHIVKAGTAGREVVLEVIPPGELFGAVAAIESRRYPASAVAAEASVIWRLRASLVRELCQRHPTLRAAILEQVTCRLRDAHERLRSVAVERVEQRLARILLTLAQKIGRTENQVTILNVSRQELADMIGTTVETTIRVMMKWQNGGIVSSSRNKIGLRDPVRLGAIAKGS